MTQEHKNFRDAYLSLLNVAIRGVRRSIEMKDFETATDLMDALNHMFYHPGFMIPESLLTSDEVDKVKDKINAIEGYLDEARP